MRSPKLLDIFNIITCHGNREMTATRFIQAVEIIENIGNAVHFTRMHGKYIADDKSEVTIDMLMNHNHVIEGDHGYYFKKDSDTCSLCGKRKVKIDGGYEHICAQKIEKP